MSRFLIFERIAGSAKTETWSVKSAQSGDLLGMVRWFGRWRQYAFFPTAGAAFNPECLADLADFVDDLTIRHRVAAR